MKSLLITATLLALSATALRVDKTAFTIPVPAGVSTDPQVFSRAEGSDILYFATGQEDSGVGAANLKNRSLDWTKRIHGSNSLSNVWAVGAYPSGGVLQASASENFSPANPIVSRLDATGRTLWSKSVPLYGGGAKSKIAFLQSHQKAVVTDSVSVSVLNTQDGTVQYNATTAFGLFVDADTAYIQSGSGSLKAVDLHTFADRWSFPSGSFSDELSYLFPGKLLLTTNYTSISGNPALYLINPTTGKVIGSVDEVSGFNNQIYEGYLPKLDGDKLKFTLPNTIPGIWDNYVVDATTGNLISRTQVYQEPSTPSPAPYGSLPVTKYGSDEIYLTATAIVAKKKAE